MNCRSVFLWLLPLLTGGTLLSGQETLTETFKIDLSSPDERSKLNVNLNEGTIRIIGFHDRRNLEITASVMDNIYRTGQDTSSLKAVPNLNYELEISEKDNVVNIRSHTNKMIYLTLKVPRQIDLEVNTYNDSEGIFIKQIEGDISTKCYNSQIELLDISGSVNATIQYSSSPITAKFAAVNNNPMAFSTYGGDINISFPDDVSMTAQLNSDNGRIYTDFNLERIRTRPIRNRDRERNRTSISVQGLIKYKINGGGPDLICKSIEGDIFIKKH